MKTSFRSIGLPLVVLVMALHVAGVSRVRADAYSDAVMADNPAAYFRLTETNGNFLSVDNVYTGVVHGAALFRGLLGPGPRIASLRQTFLFNGLDLDNIGVLLTNSLAPRGESSDSGISVTNTAALNPGTNSFTMEAWTLIPVNYNTNPPLGVGTILNKYSGGVFGLRTTVKTNDNTIRVYGLMQGTNGLSSTPEAMLTTGVWHYVAAVYDRKEPGTQDEATIYVDGVWVAMTNSSELKEGGVLGGAAQDIQPQWQLGIGAAVTNTGGVYGHGLPGRIDEVAIYTHALTAAQISNHYAAAQGSLRGTATPPVTAGLLIALQGGSAITSPAGAVGIWVDEAWQGGYQDFSQSTSLRRPAWSRDTVPTGRSVGVLNFDKASTNYLELEASSVMDTNTWTWFVAFKPGLGGLLLRSAYTAGAGTGTSASSNLWGSHAYTTPGKLVTFTRDANGLGYSSTFSPTVSNQWFVMSGTWNGTTAVLNGNPATNLTGRLQQELRTASYAPQSTNGPNANPSGHVRTRVGVNSADLLYPFDGKIAEILIYNTALPSSDVGTVETYLVRKYLVLSKSTIVIVR